tara:strand:- start:206 stop:868 length:663 start_codon:yes stop_codon:yes gene_type:complete
MFKKLLKIILTLFALFVAGSLCLALWYGIGEDLYKELTFEHPTSLNGVEFGDSISDVIFNHGNPERSEDGLTLLYYTGYGDSKDLDWIVGLSENGTVEVVRDYKNAYYELKNFPFQTLQELEQLMGPPAMVAVSSNYVSRRVTYLQDRPLGVTYRFDKNQLEAVMIGKVSWRGHFLVDELLGKRGDYFVRGKQLCFVDESLNDNCPISKDNGITIWDYID